MLSKEDILKEILKRYEKLIIAFSGGVDSTYLAKIAFDTLGQNAIAVTAASETYTKDELEFAKKITKEWGMRHIVLETSELNIPNFKNNPEDRCYYCKYELFSKLKALAKELGANVVVEGSNIDDLSDHRPGFKAIKELGIKSPLLEAGLTKAAVRELSKQIGLPTFNKPALACLASRFPYGEEITKEKLRKVERAEQYIKSFYQKHYPFQLRVRHLNGKAMIEIGQKMIPQLKSNFKVVEKELKGLGFEEVEVDPLGYRMGSMNVVVKTSPPNER